MKFDAMRRSSERRPLSLTVKSRVRARVVYVDLVDISEGGCKIRGRRGFAQVGDRVTMKVNGINAPLGAVVWTREDLAGIAFEGAIHPAVLDFLCDGQAVATSGSQYRRLL